jgi:hypothetical protein
MRRSKRDRDKPIPKSDLDRIAFFRAELEAMQKLMEQGKTRAEARAIVWAEYMPPKEN